MYTETELLKAIASGNEAAFNVLFEKYRTKLYGYIFTISKSKEATEEILIDVFLKLWMGKEMLEEIENLDAFLGKMAHNKAIDYLRMSSRAAKNEKLSRQELFPAIETETDYKLREGECQLLLNKAIDQLSPQRKNVFMLSRQQEFTYDEIASELNLSRNTVRNTMAETLKFFKSFLGRHSIYATIAVILLLSA